MTASDLVDRELVPPAISPPLVARYLDRLGVAQERPSPAALARLHRAHVERVPYETFWLHLGHDIGIAPAASARRIATTGGGGYCFQLNGAFAELLAALGYRVTRHLAGVHDSAGATPAVLGNHVALIVHDLPTADHPTGRWYVDTGLGDVLHAPLPLRPGRTVQGHLTLNVSRAAVDVDGWHVGYESAAACGGVTIAPEPVTLDVFRDRHRHNVSSPASHFRRTVTCQRRHATGADVLRGRVLTRSGGPTAVSHTVVESPAELVAVLDEVFELHLDASRSELDRLWTSIEAAHDGWLARAAVAA